MRGRHTPPAPLKRGDLDARFLLEMGMLCGEVGCCFFLANEGGVSGGLPLLRGDKGVCYDERSGLG